MHGEDASLQNWKGPAKNQTHDPPVRDKDSCKPGDKVVARVRYNGLGDVTYPRLGLLQLYEKFTVLRRMYASKQLAEHGL